MEKNYISNITEARRLTAEAGPMLIAEGLAARTWGNVSCRTGWHGMVISPSGLSYEDMTEDDIVFLDFLSGEGEPGKKPSSEKAVHIAAYEVFPEAGFVIHTHQTYASAMGLAGFENLDLSVEEQYLLGGVALAEYGLPGTEKLAGNIRAVMRTGAHSVLMAHHGAVIAGENREQAFARAKLLEEVCKRSCLGQPNEPKESPEAERSEGLLLSSAANTFDFTACSRTPAVLAAARCREVIPTQLDDMAQMVGRSLVTVMPEKDRMLRALKHHPVVLVRGVGAVSRAGSQEDANALCMLTEKACLCYLHTKVLGVNASLDMPDILRMRHTYRVHYSRQIHEKDGKIERNRKILG